MKTRYWLLSIAFVVLPISLRAGDEPKSFSVPFDTIKTQHMVVSVKINGKGPYRLVFVPSHRGEHASVAFVTVTFR